MGGFELYKKNTHIFGYKGIWDDPIPLDWEDIDALFKVADDGTAYEIDGVKMTGHAIVRAPTRLSVDPTKPIVDILRDGEIVKIDIREDGQHWKIHLDDVGDVWINPKDVVTTFFTGDKKLDKGDGFVYN